MCPTQLWVLAGEMDLDNTDKNGALVCLHSEEGNLLINNRLTDKQENPRPISSTRKLIEGEGYEERVTFV